MKDRSPPAASSPATIRPEVDLPLASPTERDPSHEVIWRAEPPVDVDVQACPWWWVKQGDEMPVVVRLVAQGASVWTIHASGARLPFRPADWGDLARWAPCLPPATADAGALTRRIAQVLHEIWDYLFDLRSRTTWDDPRGDDLDHLLMLDASSDFFDTEHCLQTMRQIADPTRPDDPVHRAMRRAGLA